MKLIVGLGNPGPEYAFSRHNAGWWAVDRLIDRLDGGSGKDRFMGRFYGPLSYQGHRVGLLRPLTYMNLSGQSLRACVDFYNVDDEDLLLLYDDIDLPAGRLRLRFKGSAGGHNGVKSVIAHWGSDRFARVKIGVGAKPEGSDLVRHVLGTPSPSDRKLIEEACDFAAQAALCWLEGMEANALTSLVGGYRSE